MPIPLHATPGRARPSKWRIAAATVLALVLFVVAVGVGIYANLFGRIKTVTVDVADGSGNTVEIPTDLSAGVPVNIVVIGTDDRSGGNAAIGGEEEGVRGDVTILVHIDADRSAVRMASIPRDLMMDMPECTSGDVATPAHFGQFNTAFTTGYGDSGDMGGAVSCVMQTVHAATGIMPDAAAVLDFTAVVSVVDALGGVEICGEDRFEPDMAGGLVLDAGCHTLDGMQAVQFVRARYVNSDGSDLKRIERQQCFLRQAARQTLSGGLLSQASKVLSVASIIADNTTMTHNLASPTALAGLLYSLKDLAPGAITSGSPPLADWPEDKNRVIWAEGATEFWADFATDEATRRAAAAAQSGDGSQSNAGAGVAEEDSGSGGADGGVTAVSPDESASGAPVVAPSVEYCY